VRDGVRHILSRRRATAGLHAAHPVRIIDCGNAALFGFVRAAPTGNVLCLFNFTESWQHLPEGWLRAQGVVRMHDALSDAPVEVHHGNVALPPYARVWME
jgi:amylosucrase